MLLGTVSVILRRLPHAGKAHALNAAVLQTTADVVLTVDADIVVDPRRRCGCGMRSPESPNWSASPESSPWSHGAPRRANAAVLPNLRIHPQFRSLCLDAGQLPAVDLRAFAGFRRAAVVDVGGFDDACLVEDYELVHRLYRYSSERQLNWRFRVLGDAQARTTAPGSVPALLRQRRRWFGDFCKPSGGIAPPVAAGGWDGSARSCCRSRL